MYRHNIYILICTMYKWIFIIVFFVEYNFRTVPLSHFFSRQKYFIIEINLCNCLFSSPMRTKIMSSLGKLNNVLTKFKSLFPFLYIPLIHTANTMWQIIQTVKMKTSTIQTKFQTSLVRAVYIRIYLCVLSINHFRENVQIDMTN